MIESNKIISFNTFFFLEFIKKVIEKVEQLLDPIAVEFLRTLEFNLRNSEDPIEILGKMAKFQQTNEMTIFLFDMLNRLEKIKPEKAMESLDELADDFTNLLSLMMEDDEVLRGLSEVQENFIPLPQATTEVESSQSAKPEQWMNFNEFYLKFIREKILNSFPSATREEMELALENLILNLNQKAAWIAEINPFMQWLREILPENLTTLPATQLMALANERIPQIVKGMKELKANHPELIESILSTGKIPVEEEKGEQTIDDLLKAYFYSEVEDHVKILEDIVSKPLNSESLPELIKNLKSLKELSMIHGYSGIEFYCDNIIKTLRRKQEKILKNPQQAQSLLNEMLTVLKDVEHFESQLTTEEQRNFVNQFDQDLDKAFEEKEAAAQAEPAPEAEAAETLISLEDADQIHQVFKDLCDKLTERLLPFSPDAQNNLFVEALDSLEKTASLVEPDLPAEILAPFKEKYQQVLTAEKIDQQQALSQLQSIWKKFRDQLVGGRDFSEVKTLLAGFDVQAFQKEDQFAAKESPVQQAMVEALRGLWVQVKPILAEGLVHRDSKFLKDLESFLTQTSSDLKLLSLQNYLSFPEFLLQHLQVEKAKPLSEDLVEEIEKAVDLFFERLEKQGAEGQVDDLVEVLKELLPVEGKVTKPEMAVSEDERDFREESRQHIETAQQLLNKLIDEPQQREIFKEISAEIHTIYSAAQFLGKERLADSALIIEETVEMFSDPSLELPENLFDALKNALEALLNTIQNPQEEHDEAFQKLQKILDSLVLEEQVEGEETAPAETETAEAGGVKEKPLFTPAATGPAEVKEIFKEDAQSLIVELQRANASLIQNPQDEAAIYQMDQTLHALKNAAKMTGQNDLALIFGRMEEIMEDIKNDPSTNTEEIQKELKPIIDELDSIIIKGEVEEAELDTLLLKLDAILNKVLSVRKSEDERTKRLRELFLEEANDLVEKINNDLLELEKVPESSTVLADLLRHLHTLKGGALMANFNKIGEVAHKLEDYFQLYRSQNAETKLELLPTAFTMIDLISEMLRAIEIGKPEIVSNFTARLADMDNKLFFLKDFEIPREMLEQIPAMAPKPSSPVAVQESDNTLKVKASYLDHLINLATEMVISRTELNSYFEKLKNLFYELDNRKKDLRGFAHQLEDFVEERTFNDLKGMMPQSAEDWEMLRNFAEMIKSISGDYYKTTGAMGKIIRFLERHISQLSVLSKSIHNDLLKARMVPISSLFERFKRPVRDLAKQQKKQVELIIEDNDAEMDRAMIEALYEPLLHILRNAVDHGIEKSTEREKAGKDPVGKIILRARQEKSQVVIDVIDDGRGIDLEKVKEKIVKLKLASKKEVAKMPESRLLEYIFLPDFSTKGRATKTSGRGIGLDVVAMEIQKLKGIVRVKTTPDQGAIFSIRVPLTLIVSHAMLLKFHDITLAIPLLAVMESIKITEKDILVDDERKYIQVRGKLLPYVDLDDILVFPHGEQPAPAPKNIALVLHDSGVSIALGVEEIKGRQDIIIKNLGNLLQNVELISGGAILPDGEVALILDYAGVIHKVEADYFGLTREKVLIRKVLPKAAEPERKEQEAQPQPKEFMVKKVVGRKPRVLVVDDSASVRNFVSAFLKKHGFETIEAKDGQEALEKAKEAEVDLLITDLQMPKMNGFKLSEQIRALDQYKKLPIIILTAQVGKKQEQKSEAVGANAFVSKPFKEDDLIRMVKTFVQVE